MKLIAIFYSILIGTLAVQVYNILHYINNNKCLNTDNSELVYNYKRFLKSDLMKEISSIEDTKYNE